MPELDNTLERPPHTYSKDPASLWARLLSVFTIEIDAIQATREAIQAAHDIDQATGKTLDFIGANVQQGRGKTNDGLYRILIKSKIARNICQGSIDELIKTIALTMNCLESEVSIIEQWELTPATEAALIITVPDYALLNVGMTPGQFTQFMGKLVAAGVGVGALYSGSFCFSAQYETPTTDSDHGFDAGELGAYYTTISEEGDELPI